MKRSTKFSPDVCERAVRLVFESRGEHASQWAAISAIAPRIGCTVWEANFGVYGVDKV